MARDRNGNNHKAAGRPDGGQFDKKAGQGSDDDLDFETADARLAEAMPDMDADDRRRLIGAVAGGGDPFAENGLEDLPDDAKAMARIMAARGGDGIYRDLAKYNEAMGWPGSDDEPAGGAARAESAAPSMFVGVTFTPETFRGLVSGGMRDFHGADLHGLDLTGYDLKGLNLDGVNLTGANLDHADLSEASLEGAKLDGARFTHVKADGIDLTGASMKGADLSHTVIRGRSDADGVEGRSASLVDADLTGARLDGFSVRYGQYDDDLRGPVDASGIKMRDTVGTKVEFLPDDLVNGDFTNARWNGGSAFVMSERNGGSVLTGATRSNMGDYNLSGSQRGVDLSRSYFTGYDFDFTGATLRNTWINGESLGFDDEAVSFRDADLRGAFIGLEPDAKSSVDLRGARIEGAKCYGLKGRTGIRTDRDPDGREPFDPAAYGMKER